VARESVPSISDARIPILFDVESEIITPVPFLHVVVPRVGSVRSSGFGFGFRDRQQRGESLAPTVRFKARGQAATRSRISPVVRFGECRVASARCLTYRCLAAHVSGWRDSSNALVLACESPTAENHHAQGVGEPGVEGDTCRVTKCLPELRPGLGMITANPAVDRIDQCDLGAAEWHPTEVVGQGKG
jgi:hypothetical protein